MDRERYTDLPFEVWVRQRRKAMGLTQAAAAERIGIHRPDLAAIESGRRAVSVDMVNRIAAALTVRPSILLDKNRNEIIKAADRLGFTNVRVFGSVARGDDDVRSDIDLIVNPKSGDVNGFDVVKLEREAHRILAAPVDIVYDSGREPATPELKQVRAQALAL